MHWSVPGFAADDPAPGGALVFEVLRNRNDAKMIRSFYRAQTLDQIRTLSAEDPTWVRLTPPGCGDNPLCPWTRSPTCCRTECPLAQAR